MLGKQNKGIKYKQQLWVEMYKLNYKLIQFWFKYIQVFTLIQVLSKYKSVSE